MATKVRGNSFFPGYYSTTDLNGEANSSWPRYHQDNNFGDLLFFNSCVRRPVNGYSEHDKELLKQTMLQHEAIFQKQVYELHRIYRVQKELMDEFKSRRTYRSSLPRETSQSNSLISEMHFGCFEKVRQSHLPDGSVVCIKEHSPAAEDLRSHFTFMKEANLPSGLEKRYLQDNELVYYKSRSCPRRLFDLHLPAGVYTEIEDSEKNNVADSSSRSVIQIDGVQDNNVQLVLGIGGSSSCREDNWLARSRTQNNTYGHSKAYPNETSKAMNRERLTILASKGVADSDPHNGEIEHDWHFLTRDSGKSRCNLRLFSENLSNDTFLSGSAHLNLKRSRGLTSSAHSKPKECFGRNFNDTESSIQTYDHIISDSSGFKSRSKTYPMSVSHNKPPFSLHLLVPSQSKPETGISCVSVQGISGFNKLSNVSIQSSSVKTIPENSTTNGRWQNSWKVTSGWDDPTVSAACANEFYHNNLMLDSVSGQHLQVRHCKSKADYSDCSDDVNVEDHRPRKNFKGFQSRIEQAVQEIVFSQTCLSGSHDGLITRQDPTTHDEVMTYNELPDSLSREKSYSNKTGISNASKVVSAYINKYSKLISNPSSIVSELKDNKDAGVSPCNLQDLQPKLQAKDHRGARTEATDHASKTISGFPFLDGVHQGAEISAFITHQEQSVIDDTRSLRVNGSFHNDVAFGTNNSSWTKRMDMSGLITKCYVQDSSTNIMKAIDLNEEPSCTDEVMSVEILPKDDARIPLSCSLPSLDGKDAFDVSLEGSPSQDGSCTRIHDDFDVSGRNGCSQDKECSIDAYVRLTAESIVAISKDKSNHSQPSFPLCCDTLRWFADIVSSNSENTTIPRVGDICNQSSDDELDLFEAMTLKLGETRVDNLPCSSPNEVDTIEAKQEDDDVASLLFTKPRRGQTRRQHKRKNFQKDVLPGLASLSRHEIKDLQAIGELKEVSGRSTNGGIKSKAKGRKKPINSVSTGHEISSFSSPQSAERSKAEIQGIEKTMIGWGRTTRRCRRQRFYPGYVCASLSQQ